MIFKNWLKWTQGRQETGYSKMLLLTCKFPIPFDFYLLKFPENSEIKPHVDKVSSVRHFRLNIIIKKSKIGGEFLVNKCIFETKRIKFFRPDIETHSVTKIIAGTRYVLSFGFVLN